MQVDIEFYQCMKQFANLVNRGTGKIKDHHCSKAVGAEYEYEYSQKGYKMTDKLINKIYCLNKTFCNV